MDAISFATAPAALANCPPFPSDKEADSQTEEAVATIAEVQHQEQPQAGGPAQEAAAEPVETGAKPGRASYPF
ncbi:hypothetical protein KY284_024149 [Solanum tuberosum]|nr:hypothetical protein KY284_024149 [Solanum tuberosum]